ncbi:MAG: hypothetical protein DWQ34_11175 [Planctomycetota bacterium]|nr:MAG: hypothetical protein DWQ34_11175 [Planctomycetota bacterium]REK29720.1 MAG: hypothetical protein DWQ41_03525 [Planctomycetota bacterium]REK30459.1 MAG: hypothetical protein DWQ45_21510 [Planctomycetota bacterium]
MRWRLFTAGLIFACSGCSGSAPPEAPPESSVSLSEHMDALEAERGRRAAVEAQLAEASEALDAAQADIESLIAKQTEQDERIAELVALIDGYNSAQDELAEAQKAVDEERLVRRKQVELGRMTEVEFAEFEHLANKAKEGEQLNRNELRRLEQLAPLNTREYVEQEFAKHGVSYLEAALMVEPETEPE